MAVSPAKTIQTDLVAWQDIASAAQVISAAFDASTKFALSFGIFLARLNGTAFTLGPKVRVEGALDASGAGPWIPIDVFQMAVGATIGNTTLNGAIIATATTMVVTSATNFVVGDLVFIGHTTVPANYELLRIKTISGTTITFEEACLKAHDNGCVVTTQGETYFPSYDWSAYKYGRVVVDNTGSGQGIKARVALISEDSVG